MNIELVGIDLALHDVLAKAIGAGDEDDVAESRFGVEREDHAARGAVGAHHLHHADGQADLEMIEAVVDAIDDRPVGEERGEALAAGLEDVVVAADVEIALVLTGEARRRQILGGRRTAHRDRDIGAVLRLQPPIGGDDLPPQRVGPGRLVDDLVALARRAFPEARRRRRRRRPSAGAALFPPPSPRSAS